MKNGTWRQATTQRAGATSGPGMATDSATAAGRPVRRKYGNVRTVVDGITFDSKREAARYGLLILAQQAGEIRSLEVHPRFPIVIHDIDCGVYVADFAYVTREGVPVVEDVKSPSTASLRAYQMKRRLVWALYAVEIREV